MSNEPQTPKKDDPNKDQTPPGTGPEGGALTPEEVKELAELREIKKTTGFKKFAESAKEAIRLSKRVQELEEKLAKASEAPSKEELKTEYPDFEDLSPEEQEKATEQLKTKKELAILKAKQKMREDYEALPQEVREKIEKKGGYNAFRDFACSPENAGQQSLENLAKQFLYEEPEETPDTPETPPAPGLEDGTGGPPATPPAEEGYTVAEMKEMRTKNPELWLKLAKEKKLKIKKG